MTRKSAAAPKPAQPDLLGGVAQPEAKPTKTKVRPALVGDPMKPRQEVATIQPANPRNMLAVILQAASDPKVDTSKMQAILQMQKEMVAEQARLDFTVAMRELKRALPSINKDGKIEYRDKGDGKGKPKPLHFATFEHIHETINPLLDQFGFDLWFSSEPGVSGMINVVGNLDHENGHSRRTILPMPHDASGGKSGAQGWASAFSFGKRVATIGLLNIRTKAPEDRDTDGNRAKLTKGGKPQVVDGDVVVDDGVASIPVCSDDELVKVRDAIAACGVSEKTFCKKFEVEKVSQLPAARLQDALDACKAFGESQK